MNKLAIVLALTAISVCTVAQDRNFEQSKNLQIFQSIYKEVDQFYVDTINPEKTVKAGIDAMLGSLDPYTEYIPESEVEDFKFIATGEYAGVGALVMNRDGSVVISEVYEGTPAYNAGLKAGDTFLKVDTTVVTDASRDIVSSLLKGQANTPIRVEVRRPGIEEPVVKEFFRQKITVNTVPYWGVMENNTGYIRLSSFNERSPQEVRDAFLKMKREHKIESLILDLRDNGGGIMESAVQIINFFVPKGSPILSTKGKTRHSDKEYRATQEPLDKNIPLVVMINRGSASASEIVSGALQDLDRALVAGKRSYGKGLVQATRGLPYNGAVKITTAKYYIPSGRCIQAIDYSHRETDGSVGAIPDSLTTEFKTSNGRVVRDGGGVKPDMELEQRKYPNILYYLTRDFLIFDFASEFTARHTSIAPAGTFELDDNEYTLFKEMVKQKNFVYDRQSSKVLESLKEMMEFEGYMENAKEQFESLEKQLTHNLDRDLEVFKPHIKGMLQEEICKRYYNQTGEIEQSLLRDTELKPLLKLLQNPKQIKALLLPTQDKQ